MLSKRNKTIQNLYPHARGNVCQPFQVVRHS